MRREAIMRDFGSGWSGLKEFAMSRGVAAQDDTDDIVAAKIKAVIQGTLPEEGEVATPEPPPQPDPEPEVVNEPSPDPESETPA